MLDTSNLHLAVSRAPQEIKQPLGEIDL